ncbi:MAG: hypothetical protein J5808_00175 [Paludibacteraceae bacterium]|nr:hypothetical protein [Paludibacteraceae bacterium]
MKTMTEQECRAFVMSGYVPTSNEDIADIQDCFNHQSVDFQLSLLIDVETHANAERLMRACLHCEAEVDMLLAQANDICRCLAQRKQYAEHIEHLEEKIKDMRKYIYDTTDTEVRYGKYYNHEENAR